MYIDFDETAIVTKQGDFGVREFHFSLKNYIYESGDKFLVSLKRSDGEIISYMSETEKTPVLLSEDKVVLRETKWLTEKYGTVHAELSLIRGNSKITSRTAVFCVSKALRTDEDYEEDESTDILIELISQTAALAEDIDRKAQNAQEVADRVQLAYDNGEFKLRYEDMTDEQKKEMFESLPAIDPDDLDLYQDPETNFVYLVYKGIRSANGIPLAANGGGGAAANNAVMVVTNETGWQYKAVAQNADCFLSLKWSSLEEGLETGDGSVVVRVDGSLKYSANCRQGVVSLNVKEYLSGGSNTVKITISDVYGNSKTVTFTINVVVLTVSSTFDSSVAYSGPINYFYTPTGQAEKTVHFVLDNVEIGTQSITESARQQSYIIPAQSHGSHTLLVYFTALIDGELVASNGLFYDLICTEQGNENDIIVSDFQSGTGEQFISFSVPFIVYSPSSLTTDVEIYINDELYQTLRSVDRTKQLFTYMPEEAGELNVKFKTATAEKSFTLDIAETSITVQAVTNNLSLYLTAYGRSNSEEHPEEWKDERNNISAVLENFNFISDGWQSDEEKNTCLRITGGARVTVPYKMFDKDFRTEGKTIEFEFSTKEILNYDTEIINCMSGGRGFVVTPQYARLVSEQSEIDTQYKEDEHIRLAFVIEKRANNRLILMYLDGVMCGAAQYPANDNFQQVSPVDIVIGSNECTVDLYNIRVYDNDLTRFQVLENWIADTQSGELKKARWERNDVYDDYGNLVISKLPKYLPYLTVTAPVLPQYKGDKKTVEVEFEDQQDANNSFVASGVQWDVQGTSSQYYYKKNFKGKYKKGFNINGTQSATYAMRDDSIPTSTFTYKADVASSEGANNVELVRLFNDSLPYKTPPMRSDSRVRVGIDGFPIVMFHNNGSGAKFYGKMNFNNDKSSGEIFGFKAGDEFWSVENNTSRRCLYKTAEGTDEEWLSDFAGEYPEDNEDITNLKKVCEWIVSTCRENATGEELTEPVAYGEKIFTHDTEEYRLEKFRNELEEHFNLESCIYYYLYTELFLMIDSRAKNSMMTYFAEEDKWYWFAYDMDTAIGINNEGKLAYDYNLEDTDTVNGDDVFNGQKSTFWMNLKDAFGDKFAEMYQRMRSGLITYTEVERRFEEHQSKWSEAVFNEDSYVKCLEPLILNKDATYIPMLQGSKAGQRKWWLYNRFKYLDSKYMKGDVLSDYINIRAYGTADFDITPYADIYVSASFDGKAVQARARRGEVTHLENPLDDANDAVIAVYSASQIKDIGDLSGLKPKLLDVSSAVKLQRLKIGDNAEGYVNEQLTELTIGNNNLIKSIDVRNCVNLGTDTQKTVDVSGCRNVEELYFENTAINGIELPNGGVLKVLHLPRTISNLSILNQTALIDFKLESSENVTSLRVENSPIDTKEIVEGMPFGSRIRLLGVDWTFESFGEMEDMMNLLDTMKGLDEHGYNLDDVQLTGTWRIHSLTSAQLQEVRERYSWIDIHYDELILTVSFINFDGTELVTTTVKRTMTQGGSFEPVTEGIIEAPQKPDDEIDGEERKYFFSSWDKDTENILEDTVFTAQYTYKVKRYVTFKNYDGTILCIVQVINGDLCENPVETGLIEAPTKPSEGGFLYAFDGWEPSLENPVTENIEVTAQFIERQPIVTFMNGDTVLQQVSVPFGGSCEYSGDLPTSDNPDEIFAGWVNDEHTIQCARNIIDDLTLKAEWFVPMAKYEANISAANKVYQYAYFYEEIGEIVIAIGLKNYAGAKTVNDNLFKEITLNSDWYDSSRFKRFRVQEGFTGFARGDNSPHPAAGYLEIGVYPSTFTSTGGGYTSTFSMYLNKHKKVYIGSDLETFIQFSCYWGDVNYNRNFWSDDNNAELFLNQIQVDLKSIEEFTVNVPQPATFGCFVNLKKVIFSNKVQKIRNYALMNMKLLDEIILSNTINEFGQFCFSGTPIKKITFKSTPTTMYKNVFDNCNNLTEIIVPWDEGEVANAPWGAINATIHYNYTEENQ